MSGDCNEPRPKPSHSDEKVSLNGLTIAAALDQLVALDDRYHWVNPDGVVVLRPISHSGDPNNWLHDVAGSFDLDDQTVAVALLQVAAGFTGKRPISALSTTPTEQAHRTFSLHLSGVSVLSVLNAIVRTHGSSWWEARDRARVVTGREDHMLWIHTQDGSGIGTTTKSYAPYEPRPSER